MPEGYLHLTCEQRCQIYALLQSGHSQAHIARQIGVDPSTISRELVRNTGARGYRFKQAHEKASQTPEASDKPRKMTPDLVELIEEKLTQEQWSPDQISGRLAKDGVAFISHERIYQHVWKDKKRWRRPMAPATPPAGREHFRSRHSRSASSRVPARPFPRACIDY